jgi:hypothetical protein
VIIGNTVYMPEQDDVESIESEDQPEALPYEPTIDRTPAKDDPNDPDGNAYAGDGE